MKITICSYPVSSVRLCCLLKMESDVYDGAFLSCTYFSYGNYNIKAKNNAQLNIGAALDCWLW